MRLASASGARPPARGLGISSQLRPGVTTGTTVGGPRPSYGVEGLGDQQSTSEPYLMDGGLGWAGRRKAGGPESCRSELTGHPQRRVGGGGSQVACVRGYGTGVVAETQFVYGGHSLGCGASIRGRNGTKERTMVFRTTALGTALGFAVAATGTSHEWAYVHRRRG